MATERLSSLEQVRAFVEGSEGLDFVGSDRGSRNDFVRRMLVKFDYGTLGRADKGLAKRFLAKATGLSRAQLTRLIRQHAETGRIEDRRGGAPAKPFARRYAAVDAVLLAEVDETLGQVCGQATRAVMRREFEVFGDARFERLAGISTSHLYNLRKSRTYERQRVSRTRTKPTAAAIGERRKPRPEGRPGFVRVDSVHQGDLDGRKGVYEINLVDEVTQYEFVGATEAISERFLIPVLEGLLGLFPFAIKGFHADNGSEYVNHAVAACSRSCAPSSPARVRDAPTTTPSPRARTPASCAATSAANTSPRASRRWCIGSPAPCSRRTSTATAPACSPRRSPTRTAGSARSTATATSPRPTSGSSPSTAPSASSSPASPSPRSTPRRTP